MKIQQAALQSQASSLHWQYRHEEESLRMEVRAPARPAPAPAPSTSVALSPEALDANKADDALSKLDNKLQILISVVEMLTGHRIRVFDPDELARKPEGDTAVAEEPPPARSAQTAPEISIHYESRSIREEAEAAHYEASGQVVTADGRKIDFALELNMARYEYQESSTVIDAGTPRPKDPLVLNLGTDQVRLEANRFDFDLDADGKSEQVARLGSGSFFLALDRNDNGEIDSGRELFGPQSGDGFAELAALDDDGNGWIDESDAAFDTLQLWRAGEAAKSLKEAGVGAIALDHRATPFTLKAADGTTGGMVRSSGLYLSEEGQVGSVQQIDLMA